MKGKTKQEKAITLIALIITIVVLLILATVAISSIVNEDLIAHTENTAAKYNGSVTNEQGTLVGYENYLNKHVGGLVGDEVTMLNGDGQSYYTLAPSTLSFRSSADINDFQEVQINGVTLDQSNYTVTEGSTIINLSIDYLKTLGEADYSISIVSKTGSTSAGFSVVKPDLNEYGFYYDQPYYARVSALDDEAVAFFIRGDGTADVINIISEDIYTVTYTTIENTVTFDCSELGLGILNCTVSSDGMEVYCTEFDTHFILGNEDIVADEDYIYTYDSDLGGYVVNAIDKTQTSYDPIRTGINGYPTVCLGYGIFEGNQNLSVAPFIPSSVTQIEGGAFENCTNLSSIIIPSSVTVTGGSVFKGCTSLTHISLSHVMSWGGESFYGCTSLASIRIPSSVSTMDGYLFAYCTSLNSVTIPDSVFRIGEGIFANCTNLTSITYEGTIEQWNDIDIRKSWKENCPITTVKCSDGTITL